MMTFAEALAPFSDARLVSTSVTTVRVLLRGKGGKNTRELLIITWRVMRFSESYHNVPHMPVTKPALRRDDEQIIHLFTSSSYYSHLI